MAEREGCPSCDLGLSAPGGDGHICFTYAEQAARVQEARQRQAVMPAVWEGDQA